MIIGASMSPSALPWIDTVMVHITCCIGVNVNLRRTMGDVALTCASQMVLTVSIALPIVLREKRTGNVLWHTHQTSTACRITGVSDIDNGMISKGLTIYRM